MAPKDKHVRRCVTLDWLREQLPEGRLLVRRDGSKIIDALYVSPRKFDVALWNLRAASMRLSIGKYECPIHFAYNLEAAAGFSEYSS